MTTRRTSTHSRSKLTVGDGIRLGLGFLIVFVGCYALAMAAAVAGLVALSG